MKHETWGGESSVIAGDCEAKPKQDRNNLLSKRAILGARRLLRRPSGVVAGLLAMTMTLAGCAAFQRLEEEPLETVARQIRLGGPVALSAGVSKVEITPPVGTPLAGYAKRKGKPSVGIRDPLYVRALALSDGQDTVVIVSSDLLVFPHPVAEDFSEELAQTFSMPRQAIVLAATHTHSGAGAIAHGFLHEMVFGPYQPKVLEGIKGRIRWAVRQALEHQEPVRWGLSVRERFLEGVTENRMDPEGASDPALTVFMVVTQAGPPKAILVNAAAHPTLMDSQDLRFSADYPGEVSRRLEAAYPGAVCLFFNGAAGDLRPRGALGASPEERIGRFGGLLAEGATGLISRMELRDKGDLAAWGKRYPLPPFAGRVGPFPIPSQIGRLMRPTSVYLNLIGLDELVWVPLPAEVTTEVGLELKRKLADLGSRAVLLGYANGYLGYAVSPLQYQGRSYEASMTWYGPIFGISLVEKFRRLGKLYAQARGK